MQENYSSNNPYVKGFDIVSVGMGKTQYKSFTVNHSVNKPIVFIIKGLMSKAIYYAGVTCNKYKPLFKHIEFSEYPKDFHVHVFEDGTIGLVGLPIGDYTITIFNEVTLDWMFQQHVFNVSKGWTSDNPSITVGYASSEEYEYRKEQTEQGGFIWIKKEPTVDTSKFFDTVRYSGSPTANENKGINTDVTEAYLKGMLEGIRLSKLSTKS